MFLLQAFQPERLAGTTYYPVPSLIPDNVDNYKQFCAFKQFGEPDHYGLYTTPLILTQDDPIARLPEKTTVLMLGIKITRKGNPFAHYRQALLGMCDLATRMRSDEPSIIINNHTVTLQPLPWVLACLTHPTMAELCYKVNEGYLQLPLTIVALNHMQYPITSSSIAASIGLADKQLKQQYEQEQQAACLVLWNLR